MFVCCNVSCYLKLTVKEYQRLNKFASEALTSPIHGFILTCSEGTVVYDGPDVPVAQGQIR